MRPPRQIRAADLPRESPRRPAAAVEGQVADTPWDFVPRRAAPVDHTSLFEQPFASGQEVTQSGLAVLDGAGAIVTYQPTFAEVRAARLGLAFSSATSVTSRIFSSRSSM